MSPSYKRPRVLSYIDNPFLLVSVQKFPRNCHSGTLENIPFTDDFESCKDI